MDVKRRRLKNVTSALVFTVVRGCASGVYGFSAMSGYLYALSGSTFWVGFAEGIQGVAQCASSIPSGILADKRGRSLVLKYAGVVGLMTAAVTILALLDDGRYVSSDRERFAFVTAGLFLLGVYQGMWVTCVNTIYADSVPTGQRSRYATYKYIVSLISYVVGPALAIALYQFFGDNDWGLTTLKNVFAVGMSISALGSVILFIFEDIPSSDKTTMSLVEDVDMSVERQEALGQRTCAACCRQMSMGYLPVDRSYIPYFLLLTDIIFGISSGMTIKFFPLFFKDEVGLSPSSVCGVYIASYVTMSVLSRIAQSVSKRIGRVQVRIAFTLVVPDAISSANTDDLDTYARIYSRKTSLLCSMLGITALYSMAILKSWWTVPSKIIPLYVVRTSLMNCCSPLRKSILMDYTTKSSRAKWNSLDGVTRFGWSGSAFLGGWLIDKHGYGSTFIITAFMQTAAWSVGLWLLPIVDLEISTKTAPEMTPDEGRENNKDRVSPSCLREPLLEGDDGKSPSAA